jgi:hypothetical protein
LAGGGEGARSASGGRSRRRGRPRSSPGDADVRVPAETVLTFRLDKPSRCRPNRNERLKKEKLSLIVVCSGINAEPPGSPGSANDSLRRCLGVPAPRR